MLCYYVYILVFLQLIQNVTPFLVRSRGALTCDRAVGLGTTSCVVEAACPENYQPLSCSCRLSERTDDAYWVLVSQFIEGNDFNVCSC